MGRPKSPLTESLSLRMSVEEREAIDRYRAEQRPIPTAPEAVRRLLLVGLDALGFPAPKRDEQ